MIVVIFLTDCQIASRPVNPINNVAFYNILSKSNDFLGFCLYLIKTEEVYIKQIVTRLYYSYFSLARLVHIGKTKKFNKEKHDVIWQQNKKKVRQLYGRCLKDARHSVDYGTESPQDLEQSLKGIIQCYFCYENDKPFFILLEDAKDQTKKFYKDEPYKDKWLKDCDELFDSIEKQHIEMKEIISERFIGRE